MKSRTAASWLVLSVLGTAPWALAQAPTTLPSGGLPQVVSLEGESFSGQLEAMDENQAVFRTAEGMLQKVRRDQLWVIRLAEPEDLFDQSGQRVIVLAGEGALGVRELTLREGRIAVSSDLLGSAGLEVYAAATIYLPRPTERPAALRSALRQLSLPRAAQDYLLARDKKGNLVPFAGVLKAIGPEKITFELDKSDRTTDLESVSIVELAPVPQRPASPRGYLIGRDGSTVPFESLRLLGSKLSLSGRSIQADSVDLSAVAEIRFLSDRLVYLSDLEPSGVAQAGMFDVGFPYRRDHSAAGGPIRLGETSFSRGLGLHSRCELTYRLEGKYATFAATVGIDAAGGTRGRATLKVLGDGKELLALDLRGGEPPVPVRRDVTGVQELSILADYGADSIDVGDHVDLAEARLIKP